MPNQEQSHSGPVRSHCVQGPPRQPARATPLHGDSGLISGRGSRLQVAATFAAWCGFAGAQAWGDPAGFSVVAGSANLEQGGAHSRISASDGAFLQWPSFDIRPGESLTFEQPSAASVVWNRVDGTLPSSIHGRLEANGVVVLSNQNGFLFGTQSYVRAAGLVITTAPLSADPVGVGAGWTFAGAPPSAPIVNYGRLETTSGGSLFLIARKVENHGSLEAVSYTHLTLPTNREV